MATVSSWASGLDALRRRLASLPDAARTAAADGLGALAEAAAGEARAALLADARPAAPGRPPDEAPARLAAAVTAAREADPPRASVSVAAPEAAALEYGTARRPARPFLRPAVRAAARGAGALLAAALRRSLTR